MYSFWVTHIQRNVGVFKFEAVYGTANIRVMAFLLFSALSMVESINLAQ